MMMTSFITLFFNVTFELRNSQTFNYVIAQTFEDRHPIICYPLKSSQTNCFNCVTKSELRHYPRQENISKLMIKPICKLYIIQNLPGGAFCSLKRQFQKQNGRRNKPEIIQNSILPSSGSKLNSKPVRTSSETTFNHFELSFPVICFEN